MTTPYQPRLLVDFDGVIHRYSHGWMDGTAYDGPIDGAREMLGQLHALGYEIVIFSYPRCRADRILADEVFVSALSGDQHQGAGSRADRRPSHSIRILVTGL
jgi:hypothetical protein